MVILSPISPLSSIGCKKDKINKFIDLGRAQDKTKIVVS
jgi:hypothetical protein